MAATDVSTFSCTGEVAKDFEDILKRLGADVSVGQCLLCVRV